MTAQLTSRWSIWLSFFCVPLLVGTGFLPNLSATDWEAYVGQPLGVGRVTVDVLRGMPLLPLHDERFTVAERSGRAIYPVVKTEPARQFLRNLLGIQTPRTVTLYFLFRGEEPFELSVYSPMEQGVNITPVHNQNAHQRLMSEWWEELTQRWSQLQQDPEFPPIAENFLVASFSRRLGLPIPKVGSGLLGLQKRDTALQDLFGGESALLKTDRSLVLGRPLAAQEKQPLPQDPTWRDTKIDPQQVEAVTVEPLAEHVPEECFYLRFGNFTNYFWFRDLSTKWDGDFKNMLLRRGINHRSTKRIEQQLSLKENALSRILGPQFISDAAIIGLDPYLNQGAAIGLLVQARNSFLLSQDFMRQRREALTNFPEAEESTVQIGGQDVSLIATPDGRVRSYYVQSGDFHLVTTSRKMVKRFLEATQGERALASLPSFRLARQKLALDREDTVFGFFSEKFFQHLCSPAYWIESRRRMQAMRAPLILELARHAADCEGLPAISEEGLIACGILPESFGHRPDGSYIEETDQGPEDSLRGAPGFFLPVGDVTVEECSAAEAQAYQKFLTEFSEEVGQLPPISLGVQRLPAGEDAGDERTLLIDVMAEPLGNVKLGMLANALGDPIDEQLQPIEGDVVSFSVVLDLPVPLIGGERQPHMLFGGIRDFRSPLVVHHGKVVPNAPRSELIRAYVGAWPRPGILQLLQGPQLATGPEPQQLGEQMWQAQAEQFLVISFKPDVIRAVQPQLAFEPAKRNAQLRVYVDDLTDKELADTVNAIGYMRARETSVAPSRLMNSLANLLHVPREQCLELAQQLVDGDFVCPLGGEYQLIETTQGLPTWSSSALPEKNRFLLTEVPEDFKLSLLEWFRGVSGDLRVADGELAAHVDLKMTAAALP